MGIPEEELEDDEELDEDDPDGGCEDWPPPLLQAPSVKSVDAIINGEKKRGIKISVMEVGALIV